MALRDLDTMIETADRIQQGLGGIMQAVAFFSTAMTEAFLAAKEFSEGLTRFKGMTLPEAQKALPRLEESKQKLEDAMKQLEPMGKETALALNRAQAIFKHGKNLRRSLR